MNYKDHDHYPLGEATLTPVSDTLLIDNIGSTGADGVQIIHSEDSVDVKFEDLTIADGGMFRVAMQIITDSGLSFTAAEFSFIRNGEYIEVSLNQGLQSKSGFGMKKDGFNQYIPNSEDNNELIQGIASPNPRRN